MILTHKERSTIFWLEEADLSSSLHMNMKIHAFLINLCLVAKLREILLLLELVCYVWIH